MEDVIFDGKQAKAKIISSIQNAQSKIKIAMYLFTDMEIAESIVQAINRGINVILVLSGKELNSGVISYLDSKCPLYVDNRSGRWGDLHYKFCIIDDRLLLSGSYNYTINAQKNNNEDLRITDNFQLVERYIREFDELLDKLNIMTEPTTIQSPVPDQNRVDVFSIQMKNMISMAFTDFDPIQQEREGFKLSEQNAGSLPIFRTMLDTILATVRGRITGDSGTINQLLMQLRNHFESTKMDLEDAFNEESKFNRIKNQERITNINNDIETILQDINSKNSEKIEKNGLIDNKKIEKNALEDRNFRLDQEINTQPFLTAPNIIKLGLSLVLVFYLSLFFASAIWKIFFEEAFIYSLIEQGILPKKPVIFDIDALPKIYNLKGFLPALISGLFFIIPLLLSNLILIAPSLKFGRILEFILGLFFIDIVVSILVSQYTFRINALLSGEDYLWRIGNALSSGEFWMIFIFGALPLFVIKNLLESLNKAYLASNPNWVNRELNMERERNRELIQGKELEINSILVEIEQLNVSIDILRTRIESKNNEKNSIAESERIELETRRDEFLSLIDRMHTIYQNYESYLRAGAPILIRDIIDGPVSFACKGFYSFINSYFAPTVAGDKIAGLNREKAEWFASNFTQQTRIL